MGGAYDTYKTEDKRHTGCCSGNRKERNRLEDLSVYGMIILILLLNK